MADWIQVGPYALFKASFTQTGPCELTATMRHYRGAREVIRESQPGADATVTIDGREIPCTVTACDEQSWTVTVELT